MYLCMHVSCTCYHKGVRLTSAAVLMALYRKCSNFVIEGPGALHLKYVDNVPHLPWPADWMYFLPEGLQLYTSQTLAMLWTSYMPAARYLLLHVGQWMDYITAMDFTKK